MADVTVSVPDQPAALTPAAGFKSTEFATTIAAGLSLALGVAPPQYATLIASLAGVYVACRTLLKAAHALGYAKQVPDLPDLPIGTTQTTITSR